MKTLEMPTEPKWLRAQTSGAPAGVDREAKRINGYVVAQLGPFKTPGRGEFDLKSLKSIVSLMRGNLGGTKVHFQHPTLSDDGLGKYLGRAVNPRLDDDRVRADLHFADSAFSTPSGDLATYIMDLAEEDPGALSSSLQLQTELEYRLNKDKTAATDEQGEPLPPLWRPLKIHGSDIVAVGDAVDDLLSIDTDALPDSFVWRGCELLDRVFKGQPRHVVEARCSAWLNRYLLMTFGEKQPDKELQAIVAAADAAMSRSA